MANNSTNQQITHTNAWVAQTWISFTLALLAMTGGILYLPVNPWVKGYLGMGFMFSLGSTVSLSKTIRDQAEVKRLLSRVDEAKLERLLADHDPYKS